MKNFPYLYVLSGIVPKNSSQRFYLRLHGDSTFLVNKIFSIHNLEYLIKVNDSFRNKDWSNESVYISNFAGSPEFPAKLLKEVLFPESTQFNIDISNPDDNLDLNFELVFQGLKLFDKKEIPFYRYRQYAFSFNLGGGSSLPVNIPIDIGADFYVQKIVGYKSNPDAEVYIKNFDISSISGSNIISNPINFDNICGRAMRPHIIPELKIIPQSVISITLDNKDPDPLKAQIILDGYEVIK